MQKSVIITTVANNQVRIGIVGAVAIDMMYFHSCWDMATKRSLGYQYVFGYRRRSATALARNLRIAVLEMQPAIFTAFQAAPSSSVIASDSHSSAFFPANTLASARAVASL